MRRSCVRNAVRAGAGAARGGRTARPWPRGSGPAGFDLPIGGGLANVDGEARRDRAGRAGALLRDVGELAGEISEVEVQASGDLRVVLRGAGEVVLMGAPPYRNRFVTFLRL